MYFLLLLLDNFFVRYLKKNDWSDWHETRQSGECTVHVVHVRKGSVKQSLPHNFNQSKAWKNKNEPDPWCLS